VVPKDYVANVSYYTGQSWDVWGLTRMLPGGKWHKVYSKYGISTYRELDLKLKAVKSKIRKGQGIVIKDSRLTFALDFYEGCFNKIIYLTREDSTLTESIRAHYGSRMFSQEPHFGYDWVSNHFNYSIAPSTFRDFSENYEAAFKNYDERMDILRLTQEDLRTGSKTNEISNFLGLH
jgi:hypothetical protein